MPKTGWQVVKHAQLRDVKDPWSNCVVHLTTSKKASRFVGEDEFPRIDEFVRLYKELNESLARIWSTNAELHVLKSEIVALKSRIERIEQDRSFQVTVEKVSENGVDLVEPFIAVVRTSGDGFIATFFEGNVSAAGSNEVEAIDNLKELVVATYEMLSELDPEELGVGPRRQLVVLNRIMTKKGLISG
jgi:hypothetical protein